MAKDHSADLMQALVAKLYATITGNDGNIKLPRNKFVTWLLPGLPFEPRDFLVCSRGLIGETAELTRERYHQAFVLSKLFDFVPDVSSQFINADMQQTIFTSTQDSISSVYRDVLKYSKVVNLELSDKEKEKLEKYRNLMTVTKEVEDLFTGDMKQVTEPGPITLAYTTKMNEYMEAADEYMNLLIDAQSAKGNDPEAIRRVAAFANKSKFLRKKMEAAEMAWASQGYKNEYEFMNAYIDQVTQKSMVLYKQDLLTKLKSAILTSPDDGASDFYYTTIIPGNFATSPGWTKFTFYEGDYETHYNQKTSQWGAAGGLQLGLFSIGGRAGGSKTEVATDQKAKKFHAELEFTQVPIIRPWFDPAFFTMRGWTLDELWNLNFNNLKVSDGGQGGNQKPEGRLVAYPITALFVRNVKFTLDENDSHSRYVNKQVEGGGAVGWGPFFVGGKYSHGSVKRDTNYHAEGGMVEIPGIQLIGCINNLVPMCPNLNPAIKPEQLVGGV
ncbi:MAG: hypothetical protein Kow00121_13530 [Elainellaceae cyanobacterium]